MIRALLLCCLFTVSFTVDKDTCDYKGKTYKKNKWFMVGSSCCFCDGNEVGCRSFCRINPEGKILKETCEYKGKIYKAGDSFYDACNHCYCAGYNKVGCTKMWCKTRPDGYIQSVEDVSHDDKMTCVYNNTDYKKGEHFSLDGCYTCLCGGHNLMECVKTPCQPKGCYYNGEFHRYGMVFKKGCIICICSKNGGNCSLKVCLAQWSESK